MAGLVELGWNFAPLQPPDVFAPLRLLAAEATLAAPVCDSQIVIMAAIGDIDGLRMALTVNARWRMALAAGNRQGVAASLAAAVALAERPTRR